MRVSVPAKSKRTTLTGPAPACPAITGPQPWLGCTSARDGRVVRAAPRRTSHDARNPPRPGGGAQEHEAAAGPQYLAASCSGPAGQRVQVVETVVGHPVRQLLLVVPVLVQEVTARVCVRRL